MKSHLNVHTFLGIIVTIGLFLTHTPYVQAVEYTTPSLYINGYEVYDGYDVFPENLPAGVTFDKSTYTVTLTNVNITVPVDECFIDGTSYGGTQTYDLHIVLVGTNTVTYQEVEYDENDYYEDVLHNNGNMIIEGTGSLTVKNNMSGFVSLYDDLRRDLTIKDCTISCATGYDHAELFNLYNLTLNNCTLNTDYSTTREGELAYLEGRLVMNNATWNLNTSGGGGTYDKTTIDCGKNAEFHNSNFTVTGDRFWGFSMNPGEVIIDNSTFRGEGQITGNNASYVDPENLTYYNFVTTHKCVDWYTGEDRICSGKYSAVDFQPVFDITPYTDPGQGGNGGNTDPGNPVPTTPVNPVPTTPVNPVPSTPVWFNNVGSTVQSGAGNYTVKSYTEAEYTVPASANTAKVTIPDTITVSGRKYDVTSIAANAFKGNKALKSLVIGKNIKKIGKNAFLNCKKLKKITIKTSYLTQNNIGKNAFKGSNKKVSVKVPKKKLKLYKKILIKRGISKKAKIK